MPGKLTCIADYLSYQEGIKLYNLFQEAGISALVKSCGPPSVPFGDGLYFQLLIPEEATENATVIIENFKLELAVTRQLIRCPHCRSEAVLPVKTLPFWQKIYYSGTEVFKCESCGKKFPR